MTGSISIAATVFAGLALTLAAVPARADAIDGHWCFKDGRRFSIAGPQIVTPNGKRVAGDYDRHAFAYVVPAPEPGAGKQITMSLIDDHTLTVTPPTGAPETWRRCARETS